MPRVPIVISSYVDKMMSVSSFFFLSKPSVIAVRIGDSEHSY